MTTTATKQLPGRNQKLSTAVFMFGILLVSYVINAMDRQLFPLLVSDVRAEYDFGLAEAGLLSTVFTLGMGLAGIPTAFLMARLSRKNVIIIGIFVFSITTLLTAFSFGFADMFIYRAVSGLGEAMQLTALLAIAASYFTRRRGLAIGSVNMSFALGGAISPVLGGALLAAHDWRMPLIIFGLLGGIAIVLILIFVRKWLTEATPSLDEVDVTEESKQQDAAENVPNTFKNRNSILITLATMAGGLLIFSYLGMYPTFLQEELGFDVTQTSIIMSIFGIGAMLSIVGGLLGDLFNARIVLPAGFAVGIALAILLFNGPDIFIYHAILSFTWGAVISGTTYVNLAAFQVKAVRPDMASKASGIFIASIYVPAAFSGYLVGAATNAMGWAEMGIFLLGGIALAGLILTILINPRTMTR